MAATQERPRLRFIPFRKRDIIEMCLAEGSLSAVDQLRFRDVCELLQSVYHYEFHSLLENLKDTYAPLNPDRDTRAIAAFNTEQAPNFAGLLNDLLNRANYEPLSDDDLNHAFEESSLFKLKLTVDFDDFEEVLLFTRSESTHRETLSQFFGLRKKEVEFISYDRVVIYIRFSQASGNNPQGYEAGATLLKMFQNVPKADLEILFPNTQVGMRLVDKLIIGVPAVLGGGLVLTTKVGTSLLLLGTLIGFWLGLHAEPVEITQAVIFGLLAGAGAIGSFIWKQLVNFKNRKLTFMQSLTESLYFKNLDNNAGVFHRLMDDAEEEECKEAILAYYFLLAMPNISDATALDAAIEAWFSSRWQSDVDFEIDDALAKLTDLGLLEQQDARFNAIPLALACERLDQRWDEYFSFNRMPDRAADPAPSHSPAHSPDKV